MWRFCATSFLGRITLSPARTGLCRLMMRGVREAAVVLGELVAVRSCLRDFSLTGQAEHPPGEAHGPARDTAQAATRTQHRSAVVVRPGESSDLLAVPVVVLAEARHLL